MIGFLTRPAFIPPQPSVALGVNGTVLTVVGGALAFVPPGSSGVVLGAFLADVLVGAGPFNDLNPPGFGASVNRLDLSDAGASVTVTGLIAGADGQPVLIRNADAVTNLTLASQNAGSVAANRFAGAFDLTLTPGGACWAVYYTALSRWVIVP